MSAATTIEQNTWTYACVCTKISYRKYFVVSIIQGRKYFVIFNFVVLSDYENISTMKISGFTVLICTCTHIHTDGKIDEKRSATDYRGYTLVDPIPSH